MKKHDFSHRTKIVALVACAIDEVVNGFIEDGDAGLQSYTFHHDGANSVVALSGHAGTTEETTRYAPFGEIRGTTGSTKNAFRYTGRERDGDTQLYYYRLRYYDPAIGRFLSEDPMCFDGGINLYVYAHNNPLAFTDPFGLRPLTQGEIDLLRSHYNDILDYTTIDVGEGGLFTTIATLLQGPTAVTVGNDVRFPKGHLLPDFSLGSLADQAWLVHEAGHVYEHQTNPSYSAIGAFLDRQYDYTLDASKPLSEYGWEQQPSILADYFKGEGSDYELAAIQAIISPFGLGPDPALSPGVVNPPLPGVGGNPYFPDWVDSIFDSVGNFFESLCFWCSGDAGGGFVIYPNQPNFNMSRRVYQK